MDILTRQANILKSAHASFMSAGFTDRQACCLVKIAEMLEAEKRNPVMFKQGFYERLGTLSPRKGKGDKSLWEKIKPWLIGTALVGGGLLTGEAYGRWAQDKSYHRMFLTGFPKAVGNMFSGKSVKDDLDVLAEDLTRQALAAERYNRIKAINDAIAESAKAKGTENTEKTETPKNTDSTNKPDAAGKPADHGGEDGIK